MSGLHIEARIMLYVIAAELVLAAFMAAVLLIQ
jgi:hypothetical protein